MLFGGFRGAARTLDLLRADAPVILASFDYPFEPPRKFRFPDSLRHAPAMRAAVHDTIEGIGLLHAHLQGRGDVDPQRISIAGASAGAPFAVIAGQRHGVRGIVVVQGFGELREVVAHQLVRKYGAWVRWPANALAAWMLWYLEVPSIEQHAQRLDANQAALMIGARADDFIPRAAGDALWQALQRSPARVERIDLDGVHLRGADDPAVADIMRRATNWLAAQRLL